jgi:hypothetical protein
LSEGATEVANFDEFRDKNLDVLFKCVTNTPIAKEIAETMIVNTG